MGVASGEAPRSFLMSKKSFMLTAHHRLSFLSRSGFVIALWLGCVAVHAQEVRADALPELRTAETASSTDRPAQRLTGALMDWRSLVSIDLGAAGVSGRHGALRLRFDSATHAMRNIGVAADECSTVLRTHRRTGPDGSSHPGLSVALNCRFF